MIKLYDNGKYSDITIMDVYSIIYYFDECSNSIDENHCNEYKCLCKTHFNENNNSDDLNKYQNIRENIINHYKKTENIKILYENYKKYIIENFSTSNFKYNIFHPVVLYNDHSNFKITNNFELIANSDEYVIDFIITPQFNKLNFNDIMLKSIFNNFLLQNIYNKHKNFERYTNKKIYTCILSLDCNKPIFIQLNINKDCDIIKNSIDKYLINEYAYKHKKIYDFYQFCKTIKPTNTNTIKHTYNEIISENNLSIKYIKSNIL